jgi:hypothetical protein
MPPEYSEYEGMADSAGTAATEAYDTAIESGANPADAMASATEAAGAAMTEMGAPPEMVDTMVTGATEAYTEALDAGVGPEVAFEAAGDGAETAMVDTYGDMEMDTGNYDPAPGDSAGDPMAAAEGAAPAYDAGDMPAGPPTEGNPAGGDNPDMAGDPAAGAAPNYDAGDTPAGPPTEGNPAGGDMPGPMDAAYDGPPTEGNPVGGDAPTLSADLDPVTGLAEGAANPADVGDMPPPDPYADGMATPDPTGALAGSENIAPMPEGMDDMASHMDQAAADTAPAYDPGAATVPTGADVDMPDMTPPPGDTDDVGGG